MDKNVTLDKFNLHSVYDVTTVNISGRVETTIPCTQILESAHSYLLGSNFKSSPESIILTPKLCQLSSREKKKNVFPPWPANARTCSFNTFSPTSHNSTNWSSAKWFTVSQVLSSTLAAPQTQRTVPKLYYRINRICFFWTVVQACKRISPDFLSLTEHQVNKRKTYEQEFFDLSPELFLFSKNMKEFYISILNCKEVGSCAQT